MVKNKCGFVGVGAYGGNQVRPFYKESYPSLFINTALTDLNSLTDVEEKYKYHVPGSEGCNKDRKKSKELFRQEIDNIIISLIQKVYTTRKKLQCTETQPKSTAMQLRSRNFSANTKRYLLSVKAALVMEREAMSFMYMTILN